MRIKTASEKVNLSPHTLRYYEKIGLLNTIEKDESGNRRYQEKDLSRIEFIKCMREADVSIDTLKEYINLYDSNKDTFSQRRELLQHEYDIMKKKVNQLKKGMKRLEMKAELLDKDLLDTKLKGEL